MNFKIIYRYYTFLYGYSNVTKFIQVKSVQYAKGCATRWANHRSYKSEFIESQWSTDNNKYIRKSDSPINKTGHHNLLIVEQL